MKKNFSKLPYFKIYHSYQHRTVRMCAAKIACACSRCDVRQMDSLALTVR